MREMENDWGLGVYIYLFGLGVKERYRFGVSTFEIYIESGRLVVRSLERERERLEVRVFWGKR